MVELPDNSVHCVSTSPPYWGLRKYSGDQDLIWGDNHCQHEWVDYNSRTYQQGQGMEELAKVWKTGGKPKAGNTELSIGDVYKLSHCSVCGAWRGAFGLEPTPEMYIQHSVEILREIRRVLRPDGVVFWNIGDSYFGGGRGGSDYGGKEIVPSTIYMRPKTNGILKPLNLCLIPERLAIALQIDGWWVRSIIIWHKANPMPESVNGWRWERHRIKVGNKGRGKETWRAMATEQPQQDHDKNGNFKIDAQWLDCQGCPKCSPNDGYVLRKGSWRPTDSYEQILMLTKSSSYYCDAEAVREPHAESSIERIKYPLSGSKQGDNSWRVSNENWADRFSPSGRNLRNVWSFPTVPYPGAHFAVFPEKLPELCIKAATPEVGVCAKCGAPWARVVEKEPAKFNIRVRDALAGRGTPDEGYKATESEIEAYKYIGNHPDMGSVKTLDWRPTCSCDCPDKVPATVLDPFAGAGTTLLVAIKLGRNAIGYELSSVYCDMTNHRINNVQIRYS